MWNRKKREKKIDWAASINVQFEREQERFSYVNVPLRHGDKPLLGLELWLNRLNDDDEQPVEHVLLDRLSIVRWLKMTTRRNVFSSKSADFLLTSLIDDVLAFVNVDVGVLQRFVHSESDVRQGKIIVLQSTDFPFLLVLLFPETLKGRERRNDGLGTTESNRDERLSSWWSLFPTSVLRVVSSPRMPNHRNTTDIPERFASLSRRWCPALAVSNRWFRNSTFLFPCGSTKNILNHRYFSFLRQSHHSIECKSLQTCLLFSICRILWFPDS